MPGGMLLRSKSEASNIDAPQKHLSIETYEKAIGRKIADPLPIEAVRATGASGFLTVWFGLLPQVFGQFVGFSLYRLDMNIRMSIILGIVGAGGIGFVLNEAILGLEWSRVGLVLVVILAVVVASEALSAVFRKRLT